jgi:HK97 family phage prohead protease
MDMERRGLNEPVSLRADATTPATLSGYAALFNTETVIAGFFREQIAPGAFSQAVKDDDVRALFNHDPNYVLGRTTNKTLTLREDRRGLFYDVELPDTQAANDVRTLVKRGDVTGSSFGFTVTEDRWDESEMKKGKLPLRTILSAELYDVSPVTYPAYPTTSVSARSRAEALRRGDTTNREAARAAIARAKAWGT